MPSVTFKDVDVAGKPMALVTVCDVDGRLEVDSCDLLTEQGGMSLAPALLANALEAYVTFLRSPEVELTEQGRALARQRDDLIAKGVDPSSLLAPLVPLTSSNVRATCVICDDVIYRADPVGGVPLWIHVSYGHPNRDHRAEPR